jgi:hypothetical protein
VERKDTMTFRAAPLRRISPVSPHSKPGGGRHQAEEAAVPSLQVVENLLHLNFGLTVSHRSHLSSPPAQGTESWAYSFLFFSAQHKIYLLVGDK